MPVYPRLSDSKSGTVRSLWCGISAKPGLRTSQWAAARSPVRNTPSSSPLTQWVATAPPLVYPEDTWGWTTNRNNSQCSSVFRVLTRLCTCKDIILLRVIARLTSPTHELPTCDPRGLIRCQPTSFSVSGKDFHRLVSVYGNFWSFFKKHLCEVTLCCCPSNHQTQTPPSEKRDWSLQITRL